VTKVYIDCNILIDWLLDREPFSYFATKIIELIENNEIESYVSALTLANTYYIISKELNRKVADEFLKDSLKLFQFVDITKEMTKKAIEKKSKDFEGDLRYHAAVDNKLDYLITRNGKDFIKANITVIGSEEFIRAEIEKNAR
jgi:predicted nucleic acid-binding protein